MGPGRRAGARARESARRVVQALGHPGPGLVHPALIPGVGVEKTKFEFGTNPLVFAVSGLLIGAVIAWAILAPRTIPTVGSAALGWVNVNFGWLFRLLAVVVLGFMIVLGYGRCGGVRLGADDEKPEFSTPSWIAMMFSAGMGIGLCSTAPTSHWSTSTSRRTAFAPLPARSTRRTRRWLRPSCTGA